MADDLFAGGQGAGSAARDGASADREPPGERAEAACKAQPPPPLSIRAKGQGARGLNKPAIVALVGGATTLVLVLAASGLSSRPGGAAHETRPLMSAPARPEMAQGRVRDLPSSYEEAATFARANGAAEIPELGDPMAGDIAAFAPEMGGQGYDMGPPEPYQDYAPTGGSPGGVQVSEADTARRSGLFFQLHERGGQAAEAAPVRERSAGAAPDRDQMTSPHRLVAPVSRRSLHPGAIIPASLITAINSEAPGPVVAQVTQGVYDSTTGERLLIPQGARLIGAYRAASAHGQRRIAIVWARLVMPDGRQIVLDEAAMDAAGAAGVTGEVDNHWGEVFGAAALGTLINVAAAASEDRNSIGLSLGGVGVISGGDPAEAAAREGVQRTASAVSGRVVERGLAVPPTIHIDAGSRISAMVTRELDL